MENNEDYAKPFPKIVSKDLGSDDEEDKYDPKSYAKKSSGPRINVKKSKW